MTDIITGVETCEFCDDNCDVCEAAGSCVTCSTGYSVVSSMCVEDVPVC
jgi:hypothetical protein